MSRYLFFFASLSVGLLALYLAFELPLAWRAEGWLRGSLVWSAMSVLAWLACLGWRVWHWREDPAEVKRGRAFDLLMAAGLSCLVAMLVPGRAFIEHDESNMLGTAQRITHDLQPVGVTHGVFQRDGGLLVLAENMDKRGVMFPLVLACMNWLAGDDPAHAIRINLLCCFIALFLAARMARMFLPGQLAVLAPALLASFAAFSVTARGGTFDLASTCALFAMVYLIARHVMRPSLHAALGAVLSGVVAAQLRYETLLIAGLIILLVLGHALLSRSKHLRHAVLPLLPLLLVPITWRMALPMDWEMPAPWFVPWTVRNVPDNLERLGMWLASPQGLETGNPLVGLLALLGLVTLLLRWVRAPQQVRPTAGQWLATTALLLLVSVHMLSYWGQATMLITVRYFIPVALAVSILALYGLGRISESLPGRVPQLLPVAIVGLLLCLQLPVLRQARPFAAMYLPQYRDLMIAALHQSYANCNVLVLTPQAVLLLARGRSAMTPLAFEDIGLERLQQLSGAALDAVVLPVPTRNGQDLLDTAALQRWGQGIEVYRADGMPWGLRLLQSWPEQRLDTNQCVAPAALNRMVVHPDFAPHRVWEHVSAKPFTP